MIWLGVGILTQGLEEFGLVGLVGLAHATEDAGVAVGQTVPGTLPTWIA